jgi:hypothetical protein
MYGTGSATIYAATFLGFYHAAERRRDRCKIWMSSFERRDICWRIARSYCKKVDELENKEFGKGAPEIRDARAKVSKDP